jgi:FMN phosphatase YigB (HAD superfamily)|tara:strand:- start:664 stop:1152 length:489 start_codon:yes stop_codon:yes gene_type:complete
MGVLEKSPLYVFDIDRTLITTFDFKGDKIWLKNMKPPFVALDDFIIKGANETYAVLDIGVREVLSHLENQNKKIAFLSVGAQQNVEYDLQPTIHILKLFNIYHYFNDQKHILYKTAKKDEVLRHMGECVFFDDNNKHLLEAFGLNNVTAVDRKSFTFWEELL